MTFLCKIRRPVFGEACLDSLELLLSHIRSELDYFDDTGQAGPFKESGSHQQSSVLASSSGVLYPKNCVGKTGAHEEGKKAGGNDTARRQESIWFA